MPTTHQMFVIELMARLAVWCDTYTRYSTMVVLPSAISQKRTILEICPFPIKVIDYFENFFLNFGVGKLEEFGEVSEKIRSHCTCYIPQKLKLLPRTFCFKIFTVAPSEN